MRSRLPPPPAETFTLLLPAVKQSQGFPFLVPPLIGVPTVENKPVSVFRGRQETKEWTTIRLRRSLNPGSKLEELNLHLDNIWI